MEPYKGKENKMERRLSLRNSARISMQGIDVDDLDYAAGMISDGFRPSVATADMTLAALGHESPCINPDDEVHEPKYTTPPRSNHAPPRSFGTSKPPRSPASFALQHDGAMGPVHETLQGLSRSSTLSTDSSAFASAETPYRGPTGPSHPYEMYPQDVRLARTLSTGTASTGPVSESSYTGPRGPTHPYALYPQGTVGEPSSTIEVPVIPVGFTLMPDQYQRRIGPEGEDIADIIGPDGHTEQLPPYTRYPDETYARKVRDAERDEPIGGIVVAPVVSGAAVAAESLLRIPGAGGLGLATRNPEFESVDDLVSPQSRQLTRSISEASQHEINTAAAGLSEKERLVKPWQIWMRKKLWNVVPYWALCLALVALFLMGILLGAVVGTLLANHKPPRHAHASNNPSSTTAPDASAIPHPTDLPPLAIGTYGLPLKSKSSSSTCFNDTTQSQAWNCDIILSGLSLSIHKKTDPKSKTTYAASLTCNESLTMKNHVYSYGEQPPVIREFRPLELVMDLYEEQWGPAWFYMMAFNKTVILPEVALSPTGMSTTSSYGRRASFNEDSSDFLRRKGVAQSGEKPWICVWPNTLLELFIYAGQNSSFSRPLPSSPTSTPGKAPVMSRPFHVANGADNPYAVYMEFPTPTSAVPPTSTGPFEPIDTGSSYPPPAPAYPRVVKLEERRLRGMAPPVCTQVTIGNPGEKARPVEDANGNPVAVRISEYETKPHDHEAVSKQRHDGHTQQRDIFARNDDGEMSECGCLRFLT